MEFGEAFESVRDLVEFHRVLSTAAGDPILEMAIVMAIDANRTTSPALQYVLTRDRPDTGSFQAGRGGRAPCVVAHNS